MSKSRDNKQARERSNEGVRGQEKRNQGIPREFKRYQENSREFKEISAVAWLLLSKFCHLRGDSVCK